MVQDTDWRKRHDKQVAKKIDAFIKEHETSLQSAQKKQIARAENQYHREL